MELLDILYSCGAVVGAATLIQISPIKIDPWSLIARKIGNALNHDMMQAVKDTRADVADLQGQVNVLKEYISEHEAVAARIRIIRFGDEILHEVKHSKDLFDQVLMDCDKYEVYCTVHPSFKNGIATATIKLIRSTYQHCQETKTFL